MIGFPKYHLRMQIVELELKRLFKEAGCNDREDGSAIYSSHSFRTYCDSLLSRHGLDRKFVDMTVGHKGALGAKLAYRDWAEVEKQWVERCMGGMIIEKKIEIVKEVVDTQARNQNKFLLELFGKMLTPEQRAQLDTMVAESGTFHEFKPGEYEELLKLPLEQRRKRLIEIQKTKKSPTYS
jgi:hypothetical protein